MKTNLSSLKKPSILVANGVNLDLLGQRPSQYYGKKCLSDINKGLRKIEPNLSKLFGFSSCDLTFVQSNCESEFISFFSTEYSAAIINPGAWTHTSLSLADRLEALNLPFIEVHLSNLALRKERVRSISFIRPHAIGSICGFGYISYESALFAILAFLKENHHLI